MTAQQASGLGYFDGKTHILPLRIYYEDTDLSGVVYHANYLRFMERGRSEYFRCVGIRLAMLDAAEPMAWTLRRVSVDYRHPARVDDPIEVHTRCAEVSGVRMVAAQEIVSAGRVLAVGQVEACIVTLDGRPRRIPTQWRDILSPLIAETKV